MIQPTDDPFKCECVHVLDAKGVIRLISIICSSAAFPVAEKKNKHCENKKSLPRQKRFAQKKSSFQKTGQGNFYLIVL